MFKVQDVSDPMIAFGCGHVEGFLPPYREALESCPETSSPWYQLASQWCCDMRLTEDYRFFPKSGVDARAALRHIQSVVIWLGLKHEHKVAGVAYLLTDWFDDIIGPDKKSIITGKKSRRAG